VGDCDSGMINETCTIMPLTLLVDQNIIWKRNKQTHISTNLTLWYLTLYVELCRTLSNAGLVLGSASDGAGIFQMRVEERQCRHAVMSLNLKQNRKKFSKPFETDTITWHRENITLRKWL
jgi:hypothetical protein